MKIDNGKRYTSEEAARVCDCDARTIARWIREAAPFDTRSIGKYSILGRFVRFMYRYRHEPGQWHSSNRETFGEWLDRNRHRRPRREHVSASQAIVTGRARRRDDTSLPHGERDEIASLQRQISELRREVEAISSKLPETKREPLRMIGASSTSVRSRISRRVRAFIHERDESINYGAGWNEFYRRFWDMTGSPDGSWWTFQAQNETKLDWFEQNGMIGLLEETAGQILDDMARVYPPNALPEEDGYQGRLFG